MSYSSVSTHHSMVFDDVRNELYAQAIREIVTPQSVVLDLGAGMGIHGLVAARAGAKRVYLIEPEPVVHIAREVAQAHNLMDRIVILDQRIEETELSEKVDLIVSVFTGNLLYSEDLLPSLFFARDHFLKPGGRMVPDYAELRVAPVSAPELHDRHIGRWNRPSLGLDFSSGRRFAANEMLWLNREKSDTHQLAPGAVLADLDLLSASNADCLGEATCTIETAGTCHGLLCWIRIRLGDQWLSTDPASPDVHWSPVLLPLDPPLPLQEGEVIQTGLKRPARGDWTWSVTAQSGTRRHSSFFARAEGPSRLHRLAPGHSPTLNKDGENVLLALTMMNGHKSNEEIAQALASADSQTFPNSENALRMVQRLVSKYAKTTGPER